MLNTLQVRYYLVNIIKDKGLRIGVYASDELETINFQNFAIVANVDSCFKPGSHWVAFYRRNETIEFFDSLGKHPSVYSKHFTRFLEKFGNSFRWSCMQLQNEKSSSCGLFAVSYVFHRSIGVSMEAFMNLFSENTLNNEKLIQRTNKIKLPLLSDCPFYCSCNNQNQESICIQKNYTCLEIKRKSML